MDVITQKPGEYEHGRQRTLVVRRLAQATRNETLYRARTVFRSGSGNPAPVGWTSDGELLKVAVTGRGTRLVSVWRVEGWVSVGEIDEDDGFGAAAVAWKILHEGMGTTKGLTL